MPDAAGLVEAVLWINALLLIFNLLPIYPLDGGQILRALLWFPLGRARSLLIVAVIGFAGVAALVGLALWMQSVWVGIIAAFVFTRCKAGWVQARALAELEKAPRRAGFSCPSCHASPPMLALWSCPSCQTTFDTFETRAECPQCQYKFPATRCIECGALSPISEWEAVAVPVLPRAS